MDFQVLVLLFVALSIWLFKRWIFNIKRKQRRDYYRNVYLKSDDWKRKRYVVLKRDNWTCVFCGERATQVHHKRYAKRNIGKEPIKWLVSVCKPCHDKQHTQDHHHTTNNAFFHLELFLYQSFIGLLILTFIHQDYAVSSTF